MARTSITRATLAKFFQSDRLTMSEAIDGDVSLMVRKRGFDPNAKDASYVLRVKGGSRATLTIGYTSKLAPGEAMDLARARLAELRNKADTLDKAIKKEKRMAEYQSALRKHANAPVYPTGSLGHLLDYYEERKKEEGKDWQTIKSTFDASVRKLPEGKELLVLPANEVSAEQLNEFLALRIAQGVTAKVNSLHTFVRAAYNLVNHRTKLNPLHRVRNLDAIELFDLNGYNPAAEIEHIKEFDKARERFLDDDELKQLLCIRDELPVVAMAPVYMALFSVVRPLQIVQVPWEDYDLKNKAVTAKVQVIKQRRCPHVNPIIPALESQLELLRPITGNARYPVAMRATNHRNGAKYIDKPVRHTRFSAALSDHLFDHKETKKRWPFERFQIKDIRRTIKTHMTRAGYDMNTIKRLQIHLIKDVDAVHYNMYDFWTEKKAVMDRWQEYLEDLAGKRLRPTDSSTKND